MTIIYFEPVVNNDTIKRDSNGDLYGIIKGYSIIKEDDGHKTPIAFVTCNQTDLSESELEAESNLTFSEIEQIYKFMRKMEGSD